MTATFCSVPTANLVYGHDGIQPRPNRGSGAANPPQGRLADADTRPDKGKGRRGYGQKVTNEDCCQISSYGREASWQMVTVSSYPNIRDLPLVLRRGWLGPYTPPRWRIGRHRTVWRLCGTALL
jgi:hypothetical protein